MAKEKKQVSTEKQIGLSVTFPDVIVQIANSGTETELIKAAKKAALEKLLAELDTTRVTCRFVELGALTFQTVKIGMIVCDVNNEKKTGIVTGINPKTINVVYANGVAVRGAPSLFKQIDGTIETHCHMYKPFSVQQTTGGKNIGNPLSIAYYKEGDTGYLHNKGIVTPVVIVPTKGSQYKLYAVNVGSSWTLTSAQMDSLFKITKTP